MDSTSDPPPKRLKSDIKDIDFKINEDYLSSKIELCDAFSGDKDLELDNGAEVHIDPFPHCILPNFIQSEDLLENLKGELECLEMQEKNNDLYQFEQSQDLGNVSSPYISSFMKMLKEQLREWLENTTNISLSDKIDLSFSCYRHTDHLLCHDDQLEDRRIAFIFYLVPEWHKKDGGLLQLFDTENHQPRETVKSIVPEWNKFVFFKVSPVSYHQVSEVLSFKKRIALSGWFHGVSIPHDDDDKAPECPLNSLDSIKEVISFRHPTNLEKIDITKWINPVYLEGETQLEIRQTFEENSEISLPGFLNTEKYEEVCNALKEDAVGWIKKGPVNKRLILEAINDDRVPLILKECQALFTSEAFFLVLSNLTALNLHPESEEGTNLGKVFSCTRKWSHGTYTLLHDQSFSQMSSLNAIMYFSGSEWNSECVGGYTSFVTNEDNEELLQVEPNSNTLALIYVTEETSHFVKYINCKSKEQSSQTFYDIYSVYVEDTDED